MGGLRKYMPHHLPDLPAGMSAAGRFPAVGVLQGFIDRAGGASHRWARGTRTFAWSGGVFITALGHLSHVSS